MPDMLLEEPLELVEGDVLLPDDDEVSPVAVLELPVLPDDELPVEEPIIALVSV